MRTLSKFLTFSLILFSIFVSFTFFVYKDLFIAFDFNATVNLQNIFSRAFDVPFSLFSLSGSFEIVTLFLLLILYIFRKLKNIFVLLFFALFHILELFGKTFIDHPNPPLSFLRTENFFSFPSSGVSTGSSYPSGHSGRAVFVSIVLAFLISKTKLSVRQKYLAYSLIVFFDVLMLMSRVYLGEHWTTDVIGGSLLGATFALFSLAFL